MGTAIDATAEGLPPRRKLDLLWQTVKGGWVVEDYYHFRGKKFAETTRSLGQFEIDEDGRLTRSFAIPEDYGGVHEVIVSDNGATLAQGGVEVSQTFEMHPAEGPVGTPIELRVTGLGWRTMESTWVINWDNQEAGWVSATDTHGTRGRAHSSQRHRRRPPAQACSPATWGRATSITSRRRTRTCPVPRSRSA